MVYEVLPQDENQFNKFVQIELEYEKIAVGESGSKGAEVKISLGRMV